MKKRLLNILILLLFTAPFFADKQGLSQPQKKEAPKAELAKPEPAKQEEPKTEAPIEQKKALQPKKVLIVYQQRTEDKAKYDAVRALANQIAHFKTRIKEMDSADYKPGMLQFYDVIFYLGFNEKKPPPDIFYQEVLEAQGKTICWIHANSTPLTNRAGNPYGFAVNPKEFGFDSLSYQGSSFNRVGEDVFVITLLDRKKAKAHASLIRNNEYIPYAVQSGNFWYVCDLPFFLISSAAVFCDLLHEVFQENHQHYKYAMIRIEDIHPERDPKQLRKLGRIFKKYNIPFSFAVIPVYTDPKTHEKSFLSEKPYLISALNYLQEVGGTAILHGYTHQYKGESGEGHEFWDIEKDKPIAEDSEELVRDKLNKGVHECVSNGIYPLAWETPHYGASQLDYKVFSEMFSTGIERLQLSDRAFGASQSYPYFIQDPYGRWLVPENLGYVNYREGITVEHMLAEAQKILIVRDAVAVGFFHPYIETEHLERLIVGLKDLGYLFFDLRDLPNQVKTDNWLIFSGLSHFYKEGALRDIYYDWHISPLLTMNLSNQYFYSYVVNRNLKRKDEQKSKDPVDGQMILRIPMYQDGIFVVHKGDQPEVGWQSFEHWALKTFLGKDALSVADSLMRLLMWGLFIITALLLLFLTFIFISFMWSKRKARNV